MIVHIPECAMLYPFGSKCRYIHCLCWSFVSTFISFGWWSLVIALYWYQSKWQGATTNQQQYTKGIGEFSILTIIDGIIFSIFMKGYCNHITLAIDANVHVEVNVNVLFQRGGSAWEPPTFIYIPLLDMITVFVCFMNSTMNFIQPLYDIHNTMSYFIHLFHIH